MADPPARSGRELPTGTVTFLLTDVEGSTALWEQAPETMRVALARHDALSKPPSARTAAMHIGRGRGRQPLRRLRERARRADAALAIQRALARRAVAHAPSAGSGSASTPARPSSAMATITAPAVNRCARMRGLGHGGQTLLSQATDALVRDALPGGTLAARSGRASPAGSDAARAHLPALGARPAAAFPPLRALDARPHNLPTQRSAADRARAGDRRRSGRCCSRPDVGLVTLTGPGGAGKTRLARQVAAERAGPVRGRRLLRGAGADPRSRPGRDQPSARRSALAMDGGRPPLETLKEYLRDRELLLVLDNFEQVLDGGAAAGRAAGGLPAG